MNQILRNIMMQFLINILKLGHPLQNSQLIPNLNISLSQIMHIIPHLTDIKRQQHTPHQHNNRYNNSLIIIGNSYITESYGNYYAG